MKKLFVLAIAILPFAACNSAQNKTGKPDTTAKQDSSSAGATDTINGSAAPYAESTSGTDTSTDGHSVDSPIADTGSSKKPHRHP
jgi:hypothetical protein